MEGLVDGKIILKKYLKGIHWKGLKWINLASDKRCNEPSVSIKCEGFSCVAEKLLTSEDRF